MDFWNQIKNEIAGDCPAIIAVALFIMTLMVWAPIVAELFGR